MPSACRLKSLHVRNILINQYVVAQLYAKLCNILQPATCTTQRQLYKLLHKSGRHRYPHPRACTDVLVRHTPPGTAPQAAAHSPQGGQGSLWEQAFWGVARLAACALARSITLAIPPPYRLCRQRSVQAMSPRSPHHVTPVSRPNAPTSCAGALDRGQRRHSRGKQRIAVRGVAAHQK